MAGFRTVTIRSTSQGVVDLDDLNAKLDEQVAVLMITNPNTLGLFDAQIARIAELVHGRGGLIYLDGANMNAILGITRPGDFGADMMHYNPHKTFSGPHGGGGPGAGPICVTERSAVPPLPGRGTRRLAYYLDYDRPRSIGRVRSFFGNVGVLIRAYCVHSHARARRPAPRFRTCGAQRQLPAQPRQAHLPVPHGDRCMHEFVATAAALKKDRGVTAMDLAKRLLDYGFHAPTVYFPLTVPECLMVEPTETESKASIDAFAETLFRVTEESTDLLHDAPHSTMTSRPDEVRAARQPMMKWVPEAPVPVKG
jgi:glycine dehydrogenase subunit 2